MGSETRESAEEENGSPGERARESKEGERAEAQER